MGIEWEWDSGSSAIEVDASAKRPAIKKWTGLLLALLLVLIVIGYFGFRLLLQQNEAVLKRALEDVVTAEITALRIGDEETYLGFQHAGDDAWLASQREFFASVQETPTLELVGEILETTLDLDARLGVVRVSEIEGMIAYERLWFYWLFDDLGWRHVPQDIAQWGRASEINLANLNIHYFVRDEPLAQELAQTLPKWLDISCAVIRCQNFSQLELEIIPDSSLQPSWAALSAWQLRIPSPYLTRARRDQFFSTELREDIAALLTDRWLNHTVLAFASTAKGEESYLREAFKRWLNGQYLQRYADSPLLQSISERFGPTSIGALISLPELPALPAAIRRVTGMNLSALPDLDWRDYLEWLLKSQDASFVGEIVSLRTIVTEDETPILIATVNSKNANLLTQLEIHFQLVADVWQRLH